MKSRFISSKKLGFASSFRNACWRRNSLVEVVVQRVLVALEHGEAARRRWPTRSWKHGRYSRRSLSSGPMSRFSSSGAAGSGFCGNSSGGPGGEGATRTPRTPLFGSSSSVVWVSMMSKMIKKASMRLWKMMFFHDFRSWRVKPPEWISFICFRMVDLPLSPAPAPNTVSGFLRAKGRHA